MLQENSFFSTPFIYFGETVNEEEREEEENFSDLLNITLDTNRSFSPLPHIGLFFHWTDLSE